MQAQILTSKFGGELISFKLNGIEKLHQGEDCVDENGVVTIDTTNYDSYIYTITLVYEDEVDNYTSQFMFMFDNR